MRWACTMLALCACDHVFGLTPTIAYDAHKFDGMSDAPYACSALGAPPLFSPQLHQIHDTAAATRRAR